MDPSQWLVLVVEDEEDSVRVVSQILSHHHVQVRVARDGNECLTLLKEIKPTLIIMDLAMPGLDGWQTLTAIREDPAVAEIPVVAITAFGSFSVAEEALRVGFDAYFAKPLEVDSFVSELGSIVRH